MDTILSENNISDIFTNLNSLSKKTETGTDTTDHILGKHNHLMILNYIFILIAIYGAVAGYFCVKTHRDIVPETKHIQDFSKVGCFNENGNPLYVDLNGTNPSTTKGDGRMRQTECEEQVKAKIPVKIDVDSSPNDNEYKHQRDSRKAMGCTYFVLSICSLVIFICFLLISKNNKFEGEKIALYIALGLFATCSLIIIMSNLGYNIFHFFFKENNAVIKNF